MNGYDFIKRNPNFLLVWIGQVLSQSGGRMYQIAMIWWILSVHPEGAGKFIGLFMVMTALPSILLVKTIGKIIDRSKSQRILVVSDLLASILILAAGYLLETANFHFPLVFVWGLLTALLQAFIDPTLNKAVGEVVEDKDFETGIALLASTQSLANFAGAVAGALLIGKLGIGGTVLLSAFGYFISSSASRLARFKTVEKTETVEDNASGWALLDSFTFLKKILIGFGLVNFFSTPTLVVLPVYTKNVLNAGADTLGFLEASLWIGLLFGSLVSRFVNFTPSRIKIGATCLAVFGLSLAVPGVVTNVQIYLVALFIAGTALGINNVKFMSLFQEEVPFELKGRFFALMQGLIGFTFPIAYFLFGALTDYMSPSEVCLVQGMGVLILAGYFVTLLRQEQPKLKKLTEVSV